MFAKIMISGKIEVVTGMHIGTGGEFSAIGAADSPVVRDVLSDSPIIPGSTLKGKLRSVLAKKYSPSSANGADDDRKEIKRLFGSKEHASRVIFSDMHVSNKKDIEDKNIFTLTEVKFENNINRLSGVANPRQIERVIRGAVFDMELIYNCDEEDDITADLSLLAEGFKLLKYDYIGGNGSRGYGKVKFKDIDSQVVVGKVDDAVMNEVKKAFKDVN